MGTTILLVDDHAPLLGLFTNVLIKAGYAVWAVSSPASALELAEDEPIDLLITDMTMPGTVGGEGLAEALCVRRPELRVILISGYMQEAVRSREHWRFLQKPFNTATLLETVRQVLGS